MRVGWSGFIWSWLAIEWCGMARLGWLGILGWVLSSTSKLINWVSYCTMMEVSECRQALLKTGASSLLLNSVSQSKLQVWGIEPTSVVRETAEPRTKGRAKLGRGHQISPYKHRGGQSRGLGLKPWCQLPQWSGEEVGFSQGLLLKPLWLSW